MQGSVKKDKTTGIYYFIVDIGKDSLTGKRKQKKKEDLKQKRKQKRL